MTSLALMCVYITAIIKNRTIDVMPIYFIGTGFMDAIMVIGICIGYFK